MSIRTKDPRVDTQESSGELPPWKTLSLSQKASKREPKKVSIRLPKKTEDASEEEVVVSGVSASSSEGPIIGNPIDSMQLTKTMMTYPQGTLVVYQKMPYLVKNLQPFPLKLVLSKYGGGIKKVKPCPEITPVDEVAGTTFASMEEVPVEIIERYLAECITLVGGGPTLKSVLLDSGDFLTQKIRIRPMGKLSKKFLGVLKEEFCELNFGRNPFVGIPLIITTSLPSPDRGYLQKYNKKLAKANGMVIIYSSGEGPPYRKTADPRSGKYIEYPNSWIIQTTNIGGMERIQKQIILGMCAVNGNIRKKLLIPD